MEKNLPQQQVRGQLDILSASRPRFLSGTKVGPSTLTSSAAVRRPSMAYAHADSHHGLEKLVEIELEEGEVVPWWTSRRLLLSVLCFVGFFCLYALRVNLSTAIVCMIKNKPASNTTTGNSSVQSNATKDTCPAYHGGTKHEGDFTWSKESQGLLLGAFFWGYMSCQIASGIFSDRYGPRLMITIGMFPAAIITILLPVLARGSIYWMLVGRVLIGCGEAMMYPGMQSLWSKWSPPHERSRLVGFAFGGTQLGNAVTFPVAALLCAYGFDGGWPSVFYVTGMLCLLWCFLYTYFARDTPGEMPGISDIEKKYIEMSLGVYGLSVEELKRRRGTLMKPWGKILSSPAVWGIVFAHTFGNYGAYMLLTMMPTYMKEVLKFDIKANGAYSMIPYLVFWIFIIISAQIADMIISKKWLSIEWTRKLMCAIGMIIPSIFLVLTGYMDCHQQLEAVVLLSLSMGFCGFQFSSFFVNHADIAPRYAGTLFGLSNMCASIPGIVAPYIVGAITKDGTREEWLVAFYIAAAVQVAGFILFTMLAKGEIQDWAKEDSTPKDDLSLEEIKEDEEKLA